MVKSVSFWMYFEVGVNGFFDGLVWGVRIRENKKICLKILILIGVKESLDWYNRGSKLER